MNLEEKILKSFMKYEGKEVKGLELIVSLPDQEGWDEEHSCQVMETKENGKVWHVECTKSGTVKNTYLL